MAGSNACTLRMCTIHPSRTDSSRRRPSASVSWRLAQSEYSQHRWKAGLFQIELAPGSRGSVVTQLEPWISNFLSPLCPKENIAPSWLPSQIFQSTLTWRNLINCSVGTSAHTRSCWACPLIRSYKWRTLAGSSPSRCVFSRSSCLDLCSPPSFFSIALLFLQRYCSQPGHPQSTDSYRPASLSSQKFSSCLSRLPSPTRAWSSRRRLWGHDFRLWPCRLRRSRTKSRFLECAWRKASAYFWQFPGRRFG